MPVEYKRSNDNVDFNQVVYVLSRAFRGRKFEDVELIKKSFLSSIKVVYAYDDDKLIGFARAIGDSTWASIYNVALLPEYQGKGIGKAIIQDLIEQLGKRHIFTFTHPKTVSLYERMNFRRTKMAFKYVGESLDELSKWQESRGFLLPLGYKFENEYDKKVSFHEKKETKRIEGNIEIRYSSNLWDASFEEINDLLSDAFNEKRDLNQTINDFKLSQNFELAFDGKKLVGIARLVTDGVKEALLLNVATLSSYQGRGIALEIIKRLASQVPGYEIFLHAHPGSYSFYNSKKEFRRIQTAFALEPNNFPKDIEEAFFLPIGYRFPREYYDEEMKYYKGKIYD